MPIRPWRFSEPIPGNLPWWHGVSRVRTMVLSQHSSAIVIPWFALGMDAPLNHAPGLAKRTDFQTTRPRPNGQQMVTLMMERTKGQRCRKAPGVVQRDVYTTANLNTANTGGGLRPPKVCRLPSIRLDEDVHAVLAQPLVKRSPSMTTTSLRVTDLPLPTSGLKLDTLSRTSRRRCTRWMANSPPTLP